MKGKYLISDHVTNSRSSSLHFNVMMRVDAVDVDVNADVAIAIAVVVVVVVVVEAATISADFIDAIQSVCHSFSLVTWCDI